MDEQPAAYEGDDSFVFVCYAHADAATVYPEIVRLDANGFNIWYDEGIAIGSEWTQELADRIERCESFLYFVTPASVDTRHCRSEVQYALDHDRHVVVVHLEDADLPGGLQLAIGLTQALMRHRLDRETYEAALDDALRHVIGRSTLPRGQSALFKISSVVTLAVLLLAFAWSFFWWSTEEAHARAEGLVAQGHEQLNRWTWQDDRPIDEAIESFESALDEDPDHHAAHAGLCEAYTVLYRYNDNDSSIELQAGDSCNMAEALAPTAWETRLARARFLMTTGHVDEAMERLTVIATDAPNEARVHALLSDAMYRQGLFSDSATASLVAAGLDPDNWRWHWSTGSALYASGQYEAAIPNYREALRLAPPSPMSVLTDLASSYLMTDRLSDAEAVYKQSLEIESRWTTYGGLAAVYALQGCRRRAAGSFIEAARLAPTIIKGWSGLGQACHGDGPLGHAALLQTISLVGATARPSAQSLGQLAHAHLSLGSTDLADLALSRMFDSADGDSAVAWYFASVVYDKMGRRADAQAAGVKALALGYPASWFGPDTTPIKNECPLLPIASPCEDLSVLPAN